MLMNVLWGEEGSWAGSHGLMVSCNKVAALLHLALCHVSLFTLRERERERETERKRERERRNVRGRMKHQKRYGDTTGREIDSDGEYDEERAS